jgi:hypothetical protein
MSPSPTTTPTSTTTVAETAVPTSARTSQLVSGRTMRGGGCDAGICGRCLLSVVVGLNAIRYSYSLKWNFWCSGHFCLSM